MKLIFAFLFALLATWVYANPFGQEEDFNDYEIIKEERLEHEEAAVNDDDDDEEGDDDDDIDDNDDDDDDEDDDKMVGFNFFLHSIFQTGLIARIKGTLAVR